MEEKNFGMNPDSINLIIQKISQNPELMKLKGATVKAGSEEFVYD